MTNIYKSGLERNDANYTPLSPISLIQRTASAYPDRTAVIHGTRRQSWSETFARCRRMASALAKRGLGTGDTVAILAPNTPALLEAHFGVPMSGAVLNALNTRLDAGAIAFILRHGEARVLFVDRELSALAGEALAQVSSPPLVITINDELAQFGEAIGDLDYEGFIASGDPDFDYDLPADEWDAISLNYTSGTTGDPKGVVYSHRGAYLNALGNVLTWAMPHFPVYLWTLPMFHCNGWCFPWTIAAMAGTNVCLRKVEAATIFEAIRDHRVTHLSGAPIVMAMLTNASPEQKATLDHKVSMMTAAAAPPASVLRQMEEMGIEVTHVYGLTETYGPAVVCAWHPEWDECDLEQRARLKSRQGVPYVVEEGLMVADPQTCTPVPRDGETIGEVMFRGNITMKGYLKNPKTSAASFAGGWFHSGDLAVWHPNNYIEIKDRSKDIIISGGENISSIEVEDALYKHPAVALAAVVAKPDDKWGETPCAFIELKPDAAATEEDIVEFCREHIARYKCPRVVIFTDLPKTSTGKIQKFVLRERAKTMESKAME